MNIDDYRKGFLDGCSVNRSEPTTIYIMGYSFDKILELIMKDEEAKFFQGEQWTNEQIEKIMLERQKNMNEVRQKREEFRAKLSELGHSEATVYSHWALKAYDMVHCPELRKPKTLFSQHFPGTYGTVNIYETKEGLELWIGGMYRYSLKKEDV